MATRAHHVGILTVLLAGLAGFVDAVGFIASGGYFVSFMSGNSTRLGVGVGEWSDAALPALILIVAFVAGTVSGALLRRAVPPRHKETAALLYVAALLALAAMLGLEQRPLLALLPLAGAMGALNLAFEVDGDVRVGLTYMTGTLVKLGMRLAEALCGGDRTAWVPFFVLWLGLVAGGVLGAWAQFSAGVPSLWLAATYAFIIALGTGLSRRAK